VLREHSFRQPLRWHSRIRRHRLRLLRLLKYRSPRRRPSVASSCRRRDRVPRTPRHRQLLASRRVVLSSSAPVVRREQVRVDLAHVLPTRVVPVVPADQAAPVVRVHAVPCIPRARSQVVLRPALADVPALPGPADALALAALVDALALAVPVPVVLAVW
jgi:hypothetical protein